MKGLCTICALCALLILTAGFGYAQAVNATLLGTVTDSSGAVVPERQSHSYRSQYRGQSLRSIQ